MKRALLIMGVALSYCFGADTQTVSVEIDKDLAANGIDVITHVTPTFASALHSSVGERIAPALAAIEQFIVVIRNRATLPIITVALRYPRTDLNGREVHGSRIYHLEHTPLSFRPGSALVFTPDERLTFELNGAGLTPPTKEDVVSRSRALLDGNFDQNRFSHVTVSIDSVTFADGGLIGPDRLDLVGLEHRKSAAEHLVLSRLDDASISDPDTVTWLKAESEVLQRAPGVDPATGQPDLAGVYQAGLERSTLRIVETEGRPVAQRWLKEVIAKKEAGPILHRISK